MKSVNSLRALTSKFVSHTRIDACVSVGALDVDFAAISGVVRHVSPRGGIAEGGSLIQYGRIVRVLS